VIKNQKFNRYIIKYLINDTSIYFLECIKSINIKQVDNNLCEEKFVFRNSWTRKNFIPSLNSMGILYTILLGNNNNIDIYVNDFV
jgi:hypothetical protein